MWMLWQFNRPFLKQYTNSSSVMYYKRCKINVLNNLKRYKCAKFLYLFLLILNGCINVYQLE